MFRAVNDRKNVKTGIVYLIINKVNSKVYAGSSKRTFATRYKSGLLNGANNDHFRNAIKKYGENNFKAIVIEHGLNEHAMLELENALIILFNSCNPNFGYNKRTAGENARPSQETIDKIIETNSYDLEDFLEIATEAHGNKFDYSKVEYVNNHTKVAITCNICGLFFWQRPMSHYVHGCPNCRDIKLRKDRQKPNEFLKRAKQKHGDHYDYSLMNYINCDTSIKIKCNKCLNIFEQDPYIHLRSRGCPFCYRGEERTVHQIDAETGEIINTFRSVKATREYLKSMNYVGATKVRHALNGERETCCGFRWKHAKEYPKYEKR